MYMKVVFKVFMCKLVCFLCDSVPSVRFISYVLYVCMLTVYSNTENDNNTDNASVNQCFNPVYLASGHKLSAMCV